MKTKKYILGNHDIDTSIISLEMWARPSDKRIKTQIGVLRPDAFMEVIKNRVVNYYLEEKGADEFIERSPEKIFSDKKLLPSILKTTESVTKQMREVGEKYIFKIENLNKKEIINLVVKIQKLQYEAMVFGTVTAFADVRGKITNKLLEVIAKRKSLKYPNHLYSSILGSPSKKSMTEIALKEIRNGKNIKQFLKKYFWLNQGYVGRGLTEKEIRSIKADKNKNKEEKIESEGLIRELKLSKEEKRIFQISQDIIRAKSLRFDSRQFLYVVTNRIIDRIAREKEIKSECLEALSLPEFIDFLKGRPLPKNLNERLKRCILFPNGKNKFTFLIGDRVDKFLNSRIKKEKSVNSDIIKGQVAQPGKIKGRVKIVFGPQHMDKVNNGDILVSIATSPQLLSAMKKASAFITDVGGITSHAAIVARELKKPCIVGTRCATQILKDGDLVEVDANKGVVKIIK